MFPLEGTGLSTSGEVRMISFLCESVIYERKIQKATQESYKSRTNALLFTNPVGWS